MARRRVPPLELSRGEWVACEGVIGSSNTPLLLLLLLYSTSNTTRINKQHIRLLPSRRHTTTAFHTNNTRPPLLRQLRSSSTSSRCRLPIRTKTSLRLLHIRDRGRGRRSSGERRRGLREVRSRGPSVSLPISFSLVHSKQYRSEPSSGIHRKMWLSPSFASNTTPKSSMANDNTVGAILPGMSAGDGAAAGAAVGTLTGGVGGLRGGRRHIL
jgi:hypothetical protein